MRATGSFTAPELSDSNGGLQGSGGAEGVFNQSSGIKTSVINNAYGHSVASISQRLFSWNPVRSTGYEPTLGSTPVPVNGTYILGSLLNWRGHTVDGAGYYPLCAHDYDTATGTFQR